MKTKNLINFSSVTYSAPTKWINSHERRVNRDELLYSNNMYPKYSEFHDPLLDELRGLLSPPTVRDYRIVGKARYFIGKLQRKLITPKVLRDDLPRQEPAVRPIRLVDPDKVTGIFYDKNNRLH